MNRVLVVLSVLAALGLGACDRAATSSNAQTQPAAPTQYGYRVVNTYPHDARAFTQGLVYRQAEGVLYEGTGLWGRSSLRKVALETGEVLKLRAIPQRYFGEGITLWNDEVVLLTWRSHLGFVYDRDTFELKRSFDYPSEGWGITHDADRLIMSDGTATLYFLDPTTFEETGRAQVVDGEQPVVRLNELEYVKGEVWANVWQTNRIARISPATGRVLGWIDLSGLLAPTQRSGQEDVLNGIAYDAEGDRLFVTGKLWPKLFEIKVVQQDAP